MSNEDKTMYIAGTMFLALSTALFIAGVFLPKALGVSLLTALVTYIFFSECYYAKKDWLLLPIANSQTVNKLYST